MHAQLTMGRCTRFHFAAAVCCGLLLILEAPRLQLLTRTTCYLFSVQQSKCATTVLSPSRRFINGTARKSGLGKTEEACAGRGFCNYNSSEEWRVNKTNIEFETDPEILRINRRLERCLQVSNLLQLFNKRGLDIVAKQNARDFYSTLRSVVPRSFDAGYALSPCWNASYKVAMQENGRVVVSLGKLTFESDISEYHEALKLSLQKEYHGQYESSVVCLPKVFISGFPKCGSTYVYDVITKGLSIPIAQAEKEPHFWVIRNNSMYTQELTSKHVVMYLLNFAKASRWTELQMAHNTVLPVITIDGSPNWIHSWPLYFGQEKVVNYCQAPAVIPEILPKAKFLIVMRNPIRALYSAFWYSCTIQGFSMPYETQLQAPTIFHKRIEIKLNQLHNCLQTFSLDWCVVNITYDLQSSSLPCGRTSLEMVLYYVHVHKWLSVFPREHFIFLTLEELLETPDEVAKNLWQFMGIPGDFTGLQQFEANTNEQTTVKYHSDPHLRMRQDTEQRLKEFFRPYNQMLADLLGDKKFLWEDSHVSN